MADFQSVPAAPGAEPGYSLLIAAPTLDDGATWQDGVRWQPLGACQGDHGVVPLDCWGSTTTMDDTARPSPVTAEPVVLWASDSCSVTGGLRPGPGESREQRAREALAGTQSFDLAAELWTGALLGDPDADTEDGEGNGHLNAIYSDTVTDGPTSATGVLGQLVGALGQCNHGRRGMIHVTPQLLVHLGAVGAIYREGNLWYSPMGHLVVADDGYDGSGPLGVPPGDSQWAYATDLMRVRLGEVIINPPSPDTPEGMAAGMDRELNDLTVYAMRLALVQWDRCCLMAAEVDLPVPLVGGLS